jgi:hypothetical protein
MSLTLYNANDAGYKKAKPTFERATVKAPGGLLKLAPSSSSENAPLDSLSLMDLFKITDPNSLDNQIERAQHTRKIFYQSIKAPQDFVENKNAMRKIIDDATKSVQNLIYDLYSTALQIPLPLSIKYSTMVAKEVLRISHELLDNEVMPSAIEDQIYARRQGIIENELSNPLKSSVDGKLKRFT